MTTAHEFTEQEFQFIFGVCLAYQLGI